MVCIEDREARETYDNDFVVLQLALLGPREKSNERKRECYDGGDEGEDWRQLVIEEETGDQACFLHREVLRFYC